MEKEPIGESNIEKEPERKPEEKFLSLKEYLKLEEKEILSPENRWFAGEKLGHSPTDEEAGRYYVENGGAKGFAERHLLNDRMDKKEEKEDENEKKGEKKDS